MLLPFLALLHIAAQEHASEEPSFALSNLKRVVNKLGFRRRNKCDVYLKPAPNILHAYLQHGDIDGFSLANSLLGKGKTKKKLKMENTTPDVIEEMIKRESIKREIEEKLKEEAEKKLEEEKKKIAAQKESEEKKTDFQKTLEKEEQQSPNKVIKNISRNAAKRKNTEEEKQKKEKMKEDSEKEEKKKTKEEPEKENKQQAPQKIEIPGLEKLIMEIGDLKKNILEQETKKKLQEAKENKPEESEHPAKKKREHPDPPHRDFYEPYHDMYRRRSPYYSQFLPPPYM
ncbi:MAG: uncharacterized protein A8A55_0408 [Amphiamblys sp. WSBS2006]|nr:MAG: uncharacterized protein A8A55_0408 [Amphiamblys sp. WSBS2006]